MTDGQDNADMPVPSDMAGASAVATMSVADTAVRLGLSQRSVRRYIASGKLPATRHYGDHGLEYRIAADDVRAIAGQRRAIAHQPVTRTPEADMPDRAPDMAVLTLVAPLVQELTSAREQLERLARENGELRAQLRILEAGQHESPEPDTPDSPPAPVDTERETRRPWWRRIF